jgi:excisionase family DNA binding protein
MTRSENICYTSPDLWKRKQRKQEKLEALNGRWLSINELCEKLGISRNTYYRRVEDGKIPEPSMHMGQKRWYEPDIDKLMQSSKGKPNDER